ncbi:MAG: c-type cytochrome [Endozoicomonadaceae bacterium]|nr:c-type cytochrome [Endozoicomonadaceae bacterium]
MFWCIAEFFFYKKNYVTKPPHSDQKIVKNNIKDQPVFSAKTYELVHKKRCAGCHGTRGQGRLSITAPPLAGQTQSQLIQKIKAYRSGDINHPAMRLMTQDLTDHEIDQLAYYYSQFK